MLVTIMSDASVCPTTGAGGYGIWIKSDRGHFKGSGAYKEINRNVCIAEGMAIHNAVFIAKQNGLAKDGDHLILQIDNLHFIDLFNGKLHKGNICAFNIYHGLSSFLNKHNFTYEFRHVKAHNPTAGTRNYVNEICDSLAKSAMRKRRKELQ